MEQKKHSITRKAKTQYYKSNKDENVKVKNIIKTNSENSEPPKGNPTGICKLCGKEFEQDFYPERNIFSNYKTCHSCRKKISNKKSDKIKETETSTVTLPFTPHPWQAQAFEDFKTHRFNLWACGNRSGYNAHIIK